MKYDLSIIIVNYKTPQMVVELIKSINKEGSGLNIELIVVDNESSPDTERLLSTYLSAFDNAQLIINKENLGFAKANNQAIKVANAKYILLLNSDTIFIHKRVLKRILDFAKATPDAGVVAPKLLEKDKRTIQPSCFKFPTLKGAVDEFWLEKSKSFEKFTPGYKHPSTVDAVVGAAFLITPQALEKVGLLDERYFMFYEDLDYCRRVWSKGLKVYYLPGPKVVHFHGGSGANLKGQEDQWRRLIPGSRIYHGKLKHTLLTGVIWSGQKKQKILNEKKS